MFYYKNFKYYFKWGKFVSIYFKIRNKIKMLFIIILVLYCIRDISQYSKIRNKKKIDIRKVEILF